MFESFDKEIYAAAQLLRLHDADVTLWLFEGQPLSVSLRGVSVVDDIIISLGVQQKADTAKHPLLG